MSAGRLFFVLHHSINSWPSVLLHAPRQLEDNFLFRLHLT